MVIKTYLWTLPFLAFLGGYFSLSYFYRVEELSAPLIVGKPLQEAFTILTTYNLNLRLLSEKEDPDLPEATILSQTPPANTKIKPNQAIFCTLSKKPKKQVAPRFTNQSVEQQDILLKQSEIPVKKYFLESPYPQGYCIAQSPATEEYVEDKVILYISDSGPKRVLFPDLKNKSINQVKAFFEPYSINIEIVNRTQHDKSICDDTYIISEQRPLPGSLVFLDEKLHVHVQVKKQDK